jgi:hypothetical protein
MNTWLYPGWTQGSDNDKIREEAERNGRNDDTDIDRSDTDE